MKHLPKAKSENIVVQTLPDDVLIYDLKTDRAFCLNRTAAKVFESCDGRTTFDQLKAGGQMTDDVIFLALDELRRKNLLASDYVSPFAGMSRREVIRQVGLASMIALPVISTLAAPTASHAASGARLANCQPCTQNGDCASGRCTPDLQSPGSFCNSGSQTTILRPGERLVGIGELICPAVGTEVCCSGSATYSAPSSCTCNPL